MDLSLQGRDSLLLVGNLPDQQQDVMISCLSVVFHHVPSFVLELAAKRGILTRNDSERAVTSGDIDVCGDILPSYPSLSTQGTLDWQVLARQHLVLREVGEGNL